MATPTLDELRKQSTDLLIDNNYSNVSRLLKDSLLKKFKSPVLYAIKSRALHGLSNNDEALLYAQKSIDLDVKYYYGYYVKGIALKDLGDDDNAIKNFTTAIELNPTYVDSYVSRGIAWYHKREFDKAIQDYNKAIELNPKEDSAYTNRGNALSEKGDADKAIQDYTKSIKLSPANSIAFNNRGTVLHDLGEFDKALNDYNKAIELNPEYAIAYNNRGIYWDKKGETDKAIQDYNKAIDFKPGYNSALYNLGLILKSNGDFKAALSKFEQVQKANYRIEDAQWQIGNIKERLTVKINKEIENDINKIKNIVDVIRQKSLVDKSVKQVVHYSKLTVANIIADSPDSRLHYSNVIYMNDPQEGKTFLDYLADSDITDWFEKSSYKNESTIFLGSFLPIIKDKNDYTETEDQLLLWRTYGKDESGMDAGGCNFVIDSFFFEPPVEPKTGPQGIKSGTSSLPSTFEEIKKAIEEGKLVAEDTRNRLLKVQYIKKGEIITDEDGIVENLIKYLKKEITNLIEKNEAEKDNIDAKLYTESKIFEALLELCHLFKSADYSFEREVRIIRTEPRDSPNILYYKPNGQEPPPPKHFYVKSDKRILPYIQKIYLGPKVNNPSHWSLHLDYSLRKSAKDERDYINSEQDIKDGKVFSEEQLKRHEALKKMFDGIDTVNEKIKPNEIDIIPSKCRFI
jgi:tetratricopeptide (TPR) repeat protein